MRLSGVFVIRNIVLTQYTKLDAYLKSGQCATPKRDHVGHTTNTSHFKNRTVVMQDLKDQLL